MRTIFTIILTLASACVFAQLDTIPCIMMVTDTSKNYTEWQIQDITYRYPINVIKWQRGYEVLEKHEEPWMITVDENGNLVPSVSYSRVCYLSEDKKQLNKNIIVWEAVTTR